MKICIVGGVAGGASAATRLRRMNEQAEIILFEKGEHISYANCGLPYYIGKVIKEESALLVAKPDLLINRFKIDVRIKSEVTAIDRENKKITVVEASTGKTYEETYDKLILSPGASPKKLGIKGEDLEGVFSVRTVENTLDIDNYIKNNNAKSAVVAGGGFIGVEMAENLKHRGLDVTLVEYAPQIMASLDIEMANILHKEMIENGVKLVFNHGVKEYNSNKGKIDVMLDNGKSIRGDIVISALGVTPNSELAKDAGLELSVGNSIKTDETFKTSDKDIYAVGDAIDVISEISENTTLIPLAGPANRQGRSAADNICGVDTNNGKLVIGSSVAKIFDYTAASTGLNEKQLKKENIQYLKTYIHPQSHAGYYPGAKQLSLKMLFDRDGKILGAQAVGIENVEKQIDVIAAVIKLKGTVYDLEEMELCYAPPFSSAKSPVNMLGFTAGNILRGLMPVFYAEDIENVDKSDKIFLDVSNPQEVLMGTIPDAINIPLNNLRDNLDKLDKTKKIYVNCKVGLRGNIATRILLQNGFDAYNLSGGYKTYSFLNMDLSKIKPRQFEKIQKEKLYKIAETQL